MAGIAALLGKTIYLDTNLFIYAVEGFQPEQAFVVELFDAIDRREIEAVTSEFSLAELLVKPIELGREDVVDAYLDLIQHSDRLTVVPVDRPILIEAARQRAGLRILMPDAIHVATAIFSSCEVFLTNDQRIKLPATIAKNLL